MLELTNKKVLIYADGAFGLEARKKYSVRAKTADGVIRWAEYPIVGVVDKSANESSVSEVLNDIDQEILIYNSLEKAFSEELPNVLLLGVAPEGGGFPEDWRRDVAWALNNGMDIIAGMHFVLSDDDQFAQLAKQNGRTIWDVRVQPDGLEVGSAAAYSINPGNDINRPIVLTVSSDPAVGKLTTTMALVNEMKKQDGAKPLFVPTGQTSVMIGGWGIAVDGCLGDFQAGAVEKMLMDRSKEDWTHFFVKGQGSMYHPGYSNTTIAMIHGSVPTHMVFVHRPARKKSIGSNLIKLPPITEAIKLYENLVLPDYRGAKVVSISLNTLGMSDEEAKAEILKTEAETGLPTNDVVRFPEKNSKLIQF